MLMQGTARQVDLKARLVVFNTCIMMADVLRGLRHLHVLRGFEMAIAVSQALACYVIVCLIEQVRDLRPTP